MAFSTVSVAENASLLPASTPGLPRHPPGVYAPTAANLNMPSGVTASQNWLGVADRANSRLLGWMYRSDLRSLQGAASEIFTGQVDFRSKGENRSYGIALRDTVCWASDIQVCGNTPAIADFGNNRVLLWRLK